MRVLVLGASGMIGSTMLRVLSERTDWNVFGTLRSPNPALQIKAPCAKFIHGFDARQIDSIVAIITQARPQVVINCVGLVKQLPGGKDPLKSISLNGLLPHRLAKLCELSQARLVHISSDCVFSGGQGDYSETDTPDPVDIYGRSKLIGEVNYPHAVTLRTSGIGHELESGHGLLDWFLAQEESIEGYTKAVFSGLSTLELSRLVRDIVIPRPNLHGLYHVASEPIAKYDLLQMVSREYGKTLHIEPNDEVKIDRSLNASRFREATGYAAPSWPELIRQMKEFR